MAHLLLAVGMKVLHAAGGRGLGAPASQEVSGIVGHVLGCVLEFFVLLRRHQELVHAESR